MSESGTGAEAPCACKVGRAAAEYGIDGVHEEFGDRWADGDASVRELADEFNRRLLRAGFEAAGRTPIDGEVENLYRVLTDDDVDAASRTQARERLGRSGVPVEGVEASFVSHQTIYRHLVDCLDRSSERNGGGTETWRDRIQSLQGRTARVTERGIEQLRADGAVDVGPVEVLIDVNVVCTDCGAFYDVDELVTRGGCDCADTAGDPAE